MRWPVPRKGKWYGVQSSPGQCGAPMKRRQAAGLAYAPKHAWDVRSHAGQQWSKGIGIVRVTPARWPVSAIAIRHIPAQPLASRGTVGVLQRFAGRLGQAEGFLSYGASNC